MSLDGAFRRSRYPGRCISDLFLQLNMNVPGMNTELRRAIFAQQVSIVGIGGDEYRLRCEVQWDGYACIPLTARVIKGVLVYYTHEILRSLFSRVGDIGIEIDWAHRKQQSRWNRSPTSQPPPPSAQLLARAQAQAHAFKTSQAGVFAPDPSMVPFPGPRLMARCAGVVGRVRG